VRSLRGVFRQARFEQRAFWRNPDYAFFTFVLPLGLLLVLGATKHGRLAGQSGRAVTAFVPGILAFGVVVATYANLAARIAILRGDGVLKRIRTTPFRPGDYLAAQLLSTLATALLVSLATILGGGIAFGAGPLENEAPLLLLALGLGVACFASLALAVSSITRNADAAGPITNATYLPLAIVSGVFDPTLKLPAWLARVVSALPIRALFDALQAAYIPAARGRPASDLLVLAAWAVVGLLLARRYFRWLS
jgi:ABC-2 type transport system permease protein